MTQQIKVIRGMHDILPQQIGVWQQLEGSFQDIAENYRRLLAGEPRINVIDRQRGY